MDSEPFRLLIICRRCTAVQEQSQGIVPRILRDMNEGVMVLDPRGTILYMNEKGRKFLGVGESAAGSKFASLFFDADSENDEFTQFVLDAVYDKENTHNGVARFRLSDGTVRVFHMTSSFLFSNDGEQCSGVVVVFMDVTSHAKLHRQFQEASTIFAVLMIYVCGYLFLWAGLRFLNMEPEPWVLSKVVEAIAVVMFLIILKNTSFSLKDIGLRVTNLRSVLITDSLIALGGTVLVVLVKLIMLKTVPTYFPAGAPFWDWRAGNVSDLFYPLTVVFQEFLARSVMQESLNRIFTGKYQAVLSVVISALVFGALHIAYGLPLMLGAFILLGALGTLYQKQGSIWGLAIIHYVLGEAVTFLRLI